MLRDATPHNTTFHFAIRYVKSRRIPYCATALCCCLGQTMSSNYRALVPLKPQQIDFRYLALRYLQRRRIELEYQQIFHPILLLRFASRLEMQ